ncbi:MAG TPA: PIN domain-containing protein [Caulobacteraceae bacterium]|nr:PIN domain-containing protein [Caulobacteraceae bacterium]
MILLDANIAIALLKGRSPQVRMRFDAALDTAEPIGLSSIVYHELRYGAAHSDRPEESARAIALLVSNARLSLIAFDEADAAEAGEIRAHLRRLGTPIGPYDVLIAGQARARGAVLVTSNQREFDRVPGLKVLDWAQV